MARSEGYTVTWEGRTVADPKLFKTEEVKAFIQRMRRAFDAERKTSPKQDTSHELARPK